MPKVSVIVPVYNVQDYIAKCIDSILAQTFLNFELILVNDGSTDHSLEMIRTYEKKDSRIIIIDQKNGGLSDARNTGIKIATGKYVLFIDSDDFVESTLLEKTVKKAEESNADIVMFDVYQYYQNTGKKEIIYNPYSEQEVYCLYHHPEMITNILNAAWNKLYRLSLFHMYDIRYPWGYYYEDLGTTYRLLARAEKISFVNEPLYNYLQDRPGNITHQFNFSVYHVLDMIKMVLDDYKNLGIFEQYYEELKYLGIVNIMECLKKTRNVSDCQMVAKFIQVSFWFMKTTWPEFPKCKYKICREKYDWIYMNEKILNLYLRYVRIKSRKEKQQ